MATHNDTPASPLPGSPHHTIPVVEENLVIDTLKTVTGEVKIDKERTMETVTVPLPRVTETIVDRRVPRNEVVSERPTIRHEGDVTIIPVVREEAVVVKRLVLVEEIHLMRQVTKTETTEEVDLLRETVTVTRTPLTD